MKKICALLLIMALLISQFNITPVHADELSGNFYYVENPDLTSVTITGYTDSAPRDMVIPQIIEEKTVTAIGDFAFESESIQSVELPNSIVSIGRAAFRTNLLTSIEIPGSVKSVGYEAFALNNLTNLTIHDGVESIGIGAFSTNKLTTLHLPDSVTTLHDNAFLRNLIENLILPNNLEMIGNHSFTYNRLTTINIPDSVKVIGNSAFEGNRIAELVIPSTVTTLGARAFYYNALTKVTFLGMPAVTANTFGDQYIDVNRDQVENWYTDEAYTEVWDNTVTSPLTIYVAFTRYAITFNSNNNLGVSTQVIAFRGSITEVTPTKVGHTFDGWYKESTFTNPWDFTSDVVLNNLTLYAKWIAHTYTVDFNSNGGTAVANQTIAHNNQIEPPVNPSKADYTFGGWYTDIALTTPWSFDTDLVQGNMTLYASWINTYTVDFQTNGGTAVGNQTIAYDEKVVLPVNPSKAGHTFDGWYTDIALTTPWSFDTDVVQGDITLYAKWTRIYYTPTPEPIVPIKEPEPITEPEPEPEQNVCSTKFTDISNHWAENAIADIASRCIILGFPDGEFKPNAPLIRAHVAVMFTRALALTPNRTLNSSYNDVSSNSPYYDAILKASQAGIFEGMSGSFYPQQQLTRAQFAKTLVIAFNLPVGGQSTFRDVPPTHWSSPYIATLESYGITLGEDGYFKPDEPVTRAQFVSLLHRALEL